MFLLSTLLHNVFGHNWNKACFLFDVLDVSGCFVQVTLRYAFVSESVTRHVGSSGAAFDFCTGGFRFGCRLGH
jgi:hypothetical protein